MSNFNGSKAWYLALSLGLASSTVVDGAAPEPKGEASRHFARAVVIPLAGELTPLKERSFHRRLMEAKRRKADLVIIELDSPGGYVDSSLQIADTLLHVDWARTVAFVPRQAMSGAAIVSLGCDDLLIAPNAQYGDAGMIQLSLDEAGFRYAPEKARSALASQVRTLAVAKGRPPALAEAFVDMDLVVYRVRDKQSGKETYMSEEEINATPDPLQWEKLKPVFETREKHFLTMNGTLAVELFMARALAKSREELKQHYGVTTELIVLDHTGVDTAVLILNHPLMTGLIFVIGLIALYVEFSLPGTFFGGLIAGLCFAIFFWSRFLGGTAGWLEVILFVAGLAFIGIELFVIPGFGVAGITGLLLVFASMIMASQSFLIPHNSRELDTTLIQVGVVGVSGIVFLIAASVVSRYLGVIPVMKSLILEVPVSGTGPNAAVGVPVRMATSLAGTSLAGTSLAGTSLAGTQRTGIPLAVGDQGIADSQLRPAGKARIGDQYVDVVADGVFIDRGRAVRVIEIAGNRVVVRELPATS